jgi:asparagine synthase (glutamine-hydrolysing)
MCGIAGVMTKDGRPPDATLLDHFETALGHRGPDGAGRHVEGGVGLVHTRLAIIDLETGAQPLYAGNEDEGRSALIANGEIYNYVELRRDMPDTVFATNSDCETALHLYRRDGLNFTQSLRGMYALAIHDVAAERLVLARDPFGIKPLYYAETKIGFAFASEPQALIRAGVLTARVRNEIRDELLQLQFTTGVDSIFHGIRRVNPGETLVIERGQIVGREQRQALPVDGIAKTDAESALARLDTVLNDSVDVHQRADVPYGMFLSGGIDSSALLALMARLNSRPVQSFTAAFPDTGAHDERAAARAVAEAAGAEYDEIEIRGEDCWRWLPAIAAAVDDPAADYAVLPTYMLAKRAREAGLKVILSGEGGDELFAGYGRYRRALRWRIFGGRRMRRKGAFDGLGVLRSGEDMLAWRDGIAATERAESLPGRSALQIGQASDCAGWLPNDLLLKLDRCLMAFGVEGRVPFIDPAVAAMAFRLPDRLKIRGGQGKWLLRRWLKDHMPAARPFARKRGFTVPVGEWIADRGSVLGPLVAAQPAIVEVCQPSSVERLFANLGKGQTQAAWRLLFYALWHRVHVEGRPPDGDVFSVLADGR